MADRAGELERQVRRHRRALLLGDRDAARAMIDAYGRAFREITVEIGELSRRMRLALDNGEELSRSWLLTRGRMLELQARIAEELQAFSAIAEGRVLALQADAIRQGFDNAEELTRVAMGAGPANVSLAWVRLPATEIEAIVGATTGGPLAELFASLAPDGAALARQTLVSGLARGKGPAPIARQLRDRLGISLVRAMRISRTEMMRAYRTAARSSYQANRRVVRSQMWHSALGSRTCGACIAMHGTILPLTEEINGHPNCRCVGVPVTASWQELGYAGVQEPARITTTGPEWLARQPRDAQLALLGPGKVEALEAGRIEVRDLVAVTRSRKWGSMRREATLDEALGNARARRAA